MKLSVKTLWTNSIRVMSENKRSFAESVSNVNYGRVYDPTIRVVLPEV